MKLRWDFITNSSSSCYVIRNNTNEEKSMWDFFKSVTGLEYWENFAKASSEKAQASLERRKIGPRETIEVSVSYTGEPGDGLVSLEGIQSRSSEFTILDNYV